ncbi:MAG: hypothetical protein KIT84_18520 [Labilithrix sp.]|nr:hypothetical protein [Labilithrix sp.]MCW5813029.1 hypothetical protein [Labilithrix sp.]
MRFEHCYALEENPQKPMPEKASCWRDWSERYTFGQTRDRVQYAISRYVALSQMSTAPTDEAMMMAAPGEASRTSTITAPTPSNAFAPPPKVLDSGEQKKTLTPGHPIETAADVPYIDAGAPAPVVTFVAPNQSCVDGCMGDYRACAPTCEGDAGAASKPCATCKKKYAACGRSCFK